MEYVLRCNNLKCRQELNDYGVVTTCSHIFCRACSNTYQLTAQAEGQNQGRTCPACLTNLPNPDDVAFTELNPPEDYRTSVLSGLSPGIIMECTGRALSFWAYQTSQEIIYQEHLSKIYADKYAALSNQLTNTIHECNTEISSLREKLSNMQLEHDHLKRKNEEIAQAYRQKSKQQLHTQELYDRQKRQSMLGHVKEAAFDAVDNTINSAPNPDYMNTANNQRHHDPQFQRPSNRQNVGISQAAVYGAGRPVSGGREWNISREPQETVRQTPSIHRRRLTPSLIHSSIPPRADSNNMSNSSVLSTPRLRVLTPGRQPLNNTSANIGAPTTYSGYGMSAGLKASNLVGPNLNPAVRPDSNNQRFAQRSLSGFQNSRPMERGLAPTPNPFGNRNY